MIKTDVLIIGAGLAGLSTALSLPKSLNITVLSKAALEVCSSHYAQGGIAASLDKADSVTDHVADTLIAGAGLCATDNTARILGAGQQAVQWLCEQGVPFTQSNLTKENDNAPDFAVLKTSDLHLTKEGGHGCRVCSCDDATGRHVMDALTTKAQTAINITILPYHEALELLTPPMISSSSFSMNDSEIKHCRGALVFDHINERQLTIYSSAVVLASGGLGQLFKRASAPNVCVGDGVMMAWQAGCRLANLEFVQFHPTGLALDDSSFLISEALRGEGGRLYCPQTGVRFMLDVDERAELAPRDIVARAIANQISSNGLGYVHLDISHLPAAFIQAHFPQIYQTLLALGIDMTTDPIPVAPTAHYSCGGVVTCANGLTDVAGLYAAGEVAYTGLHGANRLASNSLLECVVVGRNIAANLPRYLKKIGTLKELRGFRENGSFRKNGAATYDSLLWTASVSCRYLAISDTRKHAICHLAIFQAVITPNLGSISFSSYCRDNYSIESSFDRQYGITRSAKQLEQALRQIEQWQESIEHTETMLSDMSSKAPTTDSELDIFQLVRQLALAAMIVQSAYQRFESRGGHYREDYPNLAETPLTSIILPRRDATLNSFSHVIENERCPIPVTDHI
ncbi:LOW QUALITY PROTEIN: L-aspartate oxidase [Psychrobacter sp. JCM 18901]|nr:LOW QUALITY PROTEIN: L-aspartate oxidase [Psychrobacter sp. JCM 18901]